MKTNPPNIRLDEDVLIKTNIFALVIRLQKTSSRRLGQDQNICLGYTFSRRLQDIFKTSSMSSRRLTKAFSRHLPNVLSSRRLVKTSSRRLQKVFKTFCKSVFKKDVLKTSHLQDVLQRYLQGDYKTYHQVKLFLLTRLRDIFNTFLRRTAKTVMELFPGKYLMALNC